MRALFRLLLLAALVWVAGLWLFATRVAHSTPAPEPPRSGGVVALTGASTVRLEAAMELLEEGLGERLLISGVNPDATRDQVRATLAGAGGDFDCCVDLGFQAENTAGNALETAQWVHRHQFRTLIVVTADYHMPRALLELGAAMPGVTLRSYPVQTGTIDAKHWWSDGGDARRMTVEYCKYLVILGRTVVARLTPRSGRPNASDRDAANPKTDGNAAGAAE